MTRSARDRGSGLLSTAFGVLVFLSLVLFASQTLLGLWRRSVVTAVATDAATDLATMDPNASSAERRRVLDDARAALGPTGERMTLTDVSHAGDEFVSLHVRTPDMTSLPGPLAELVGVGAVDRVINVHRERRR